VLRIGILATNFHSPVVRNTLLLTASEDMFISENGIVAVLGDENQFIGGGCGSEIALASDVARTLTANEKPPRHQARGRDIRCSSSHDLSASLTTSPKPFGFSTTIKCPASGTTNI